ncbi:MAG: STAS domain-containing protein [Ignavibacteriales bacterium]|nr:STAS domain-containing protein [Ignavibacteriales bacterium]
MIIRTRHIDGISILFLQGAMMGEPESGEIRNAVQAELQRPGKTIIMDLGGVGRMNSSGLGDIISSMASTKRAGGILVLANINQKIGPLFEITKITRVVKQYESVERAVAALKRRPVK